MDERRTAMEPTLGSNRGPLATEAAEETVLTRARVVHAAAALYLGLGSRELRGILDLGLSLADVAEWQGRSAEGLKQALLNALGRTGDHHATGRATLVATSWRRWRRRAGVSGRSWWRT